MSSARATILQASDRTSRMKKELLRSALLSVTHKLYLDAYLRLLRQDAERAQKKETEEAQ